MSRAKTPAAVEPTPRSLGYRMPAEWEPHQSTWLAWPHNRSDWPGKFDAIPWVFADIVRHLARHEGLDPAADDAQAPDDIEEQNLGPLMIGGLLGLEQFPRRLVVDALVELPDHNHSVQFPGRNIPSSQLWAGCRPALSGLVRAPRRSGG